MALRINVLWYNRFMITFLVRKTRPICLAPVVITAGW